MTKQQTQQNSDGKFDQKDANWEAEDEKGGL